MERETQECFAALGLSPNSTLIKVKEAYCNLALECNPNRFTPSSSEQAQAVEKLKTLTLAHERLERWFADGRPKRSRQRRAKKPVCETRVLQNYELRKPPTQASAIHQYSVQALGIVCLLLKLILGIIWEIMTSDDSSETSEYASASYASHPHEIRNIYNMPIGNIRRCGDGCFEARDIYGMPLGVYNCRNNQTLNVYGMPIAYGNILSSLIVQSAKHHNRI
jgi:hypothetical protein